MDAPHCAQNREALEDNFVPQPVQNLGPKLCLIRLEEGLE